MDYWIPAFAGMTKEQNSAYCSKSELKKAIVLAGNNSASPQAGRHRHLSGGSATAD